MIAVLYAESDSIYKQLATADVYDLARDARSYNGTNPVVAHPPCRTWSRLRHFSKAPKTERDLALHALSVVRNNGGVLEHPAGSQLWPVAGLPAPGVRDSFGGWTLPVDQGPFGHPARKRTLLYIVGAGAQQVPPFSVFGYAQTTVTRQHSGDRNATPIAFAVWLLQLAEACRVNISQKSYVSGVLL